MKIDISKPMETHWNMPGLPREVIPVEFESWDDEDGVKVMWVVRIDGKQDFPFGGKRILFNEQGKPPRHYEKPAILRNVQENQIMTDKQFDDFMPYHGGLAFKPFPFNVRVIDKQGNVETLNLRGASDMHLIEGSVAIAFEKVDPIKVEAQRLLDKVQDRVALADVTSVIVEVLRVQQEEGKKVDVNHSKPDYPTWFYALMEECGIFTAASKEAIWMWYMDTANANTQTWKLPTAIARKLNNRLLSIRPWTGGGQLVITPYGHGLAVTNAKKLYWQWKASNFFGTYTMGSHENIGNGKPNYAKRRIDVNRKGVEIGCQVIPAMAFTRLAERLAWPERDPYGNY